jgi:predicted metal-dependent hydrolase
MNWGLCGESLWIPGGHTEDGHVEDGDKWALTCNDSIHRVWTKNTLMNFPDFLDLAFERRGIRATFTAMSHVVVQIPGLPPEVEVRRSTRRRRSVTAYRENGQTIVVVPHRMARADIAPIVYELMGRLEARERKARPSDADLHARADFLNKKYLDGTAVPASVRWVTNQNRRWGSCTPIDRTIRLSHRMQGMPEYVIDYVLVHELVHLLVEGHGSDFEQLMMRYDRVLEARAFLLGVDFGTHQVPR